MNKLFFSGIFGLFCLVGFLYQVYIMSDFYFRYKTSTKMEIKIREEENYTTTVFCDRFVDILDRTNFKKYDIYSDAQHDLDQTVEESTRLSIKNILDLTPPSDKVLFACGFINETTNKMEIYFNKTCYRFFNVRKVVNNEHVCYYFIPTELKAYSLEDASSQLTFGNQIYELALMKTMSNSSFNFIMSHMVRPGDSTIHPLVSRRYAERTYQSKVTPVGQYIVYHSATSSTLLPKPYETRCHPGHQAIKCYHDCLIREYGYFNRVPWHSFIEDRLDTHMLSYKDLENDSMVIQVNKAKSKCSFICKQSRRRCTIAFIQTRAVGLAADPLLYGVLRLSVMMPCAPDMIMTTLPVMSFIEYLLLTASCLSFWFGTSVWTVNPGNWSTAKRLFITTTGRKRQGRQFVDDTRRLFVNKSYWTVNGSSQHMKNYNRRRIETNSRRL